jgi:hypothetical protein
MKSHVAGGDAQGSITRMNVMLFGKDRNLSFSGS